MEDRASSAPARSIEETATSSSFVRMISVIGSLWTRTLIIVCVGIFMLLLDITIVNVALPRIQDDLHTSFTDLQWVVDAYSLMLATVMLNAGSLGDLLGRKRVFLSGVVLFTVASALC